MSKNVAGLICGADLERPLDPAELMGQGLELRPLADLSEAGRVRALIINARDGDEARQMLGELAFIGGARPAVLVVLEEGDSASRGQVLETGADDCLTSPVTAREMGARLGRLLSVKLLAEEAAQHGALLARELAHASSVQRHILPLDPPHLEGLDIVAHYLPAAQLGGDFFDIIPLEEGRIGFFIADVVGHGIGSALNTMLIKSQLVIWARPGINATETLGLLNNYLSALVNLDYATAAYAIFDRRSGRLEYSLAGHPSPVLIRPGQGARLLASHAPRRGEGPAHVGLPLGLFPDCAFTCETLDLQVNDRVLLYTDGLIDWRDSADEPLGLDGLLGLLGESSHRPLDEQMSWLAGQMQARNEGRPLVDDVNLLAFARR